MYGCVLLMGVRSSRHIGDDLIYAINLGACCGIVANMVDGIGSFFIAENPGERVFFMQVALIVAINYWAMANRRVLAPRRAASGLTLRQNHPTPRAT